MLMSDTYLAAGQCQRLFDVILFETFFGISGKVFEYLKSIDHLLTEKGATVDDNGLSRHVVRCRGC